MELCFLEDPDRPIYHITAPRGWINDPNGPIHHEGWFHLFYQHLPDSTEWQFGIEWGHVVSKDLAYWEHLPSALVPTEGSLDADGCFSGCCTIDEKGIPTILYTGVRLRSNPSFKGLPQDSDLGLPFIESQMCASQATCADSKLSTWKKTGASISLPPPQLRPANKLMGWRDPYMFKKPDHGTGNGEFRMLIGSGIKGVGGAALVYKSTSLLSGWEYVGLLCRASSTRTGGMWECPLLVELDKGMETTTRDHLFCVSPDAPTKKVIYWLGNYDGINFHLEGATGPFILDLGDILYAPNICMDPYGRTLLWSCLQEREGVTESPNYSGCLTVPRLLTIRDGVLFQQPAPELNLLRGSGGEFEGFPRTLHSNTPLELAGINGRAMDLAVAFRKGCSAMTGVFIRSWEENENGDAAILYDWDHNLLEIVYGFDPRVTYGDDPRQQFSASKCVGGKLVAQEDRDSITLRVLIDGSCIEVFTDCGAVLSARVYRGKAPSGENSTFECLGGVCRIRDTTADEESDPGTGIWIVCVGGYTDISKLYAWEMESTWSRRELAGQEWTKPCPRQEVFSLNKKTQYGVKVGKCPKCQGLHSTEHCSKEA